MNLKLFQRKVLMYEQRNLQFLTDHQSKISILRFYLKDRSVDSLLT